MAISYNFHISRPNKIYPELNWDQFPLASNLGPSWEGSMPVAERHIEMPLTKCSAVFFLGGDFCFFKGNVQQFQKSPWGALFFPKKWPLHYFFWGSFDYLWQSSRVTGVVKVMQSSDCPRLWYWSLWVCILVTGNDWCLPLEEVPGECVKRNQGDFCFWKRQFTKWNKKSEDILACM